MFVWFLVSIFCYLFSLTKVHEVRNYVYSSYYCWKSYHSGSIPISPHFFCPVRLALPWLHIAGTHKFHLCIFQPHKAHRRLRKEAKFSGQHASLLLIEAPDLRDGPLITASSGSKKKKSYIFSKTRGTRIEDIQ